MYRCLDHLPCACCSFLLQFYWLFSIRRPGGNFFRSFYTATLCFGRTLFVFPKITSPWVVTNPRYLVSSNDLSKDVVAGLIAHMAECDNQAEVILSLECPECGHCWQLIFDIVSFFWSEISAQAKRLLNEVHTMAMAYGWRETDILSMSATRKQFYLEMIN